jgi:hypothetical protein
VQFRANAKRKTSNLFTTILTKQGKLKMPKQEFVVKIYDVAEKVLKEKKFTDKKAALRFAVEECRSVIKDPVHLMGIKERLADKNKMWALWDAYELVRGIYQDYWTDRNWLVFPVLLHNKEDGSYKEVR